MLSTRGLMLLALASVASLQTIQAFMASTGLVLRQSVARRGSCRGGVQALRAEREDGATTEQVKEAYKTYEMLMANKNFGKGYWMDEKPFFQNIMQAFQRNFGKADIKAEVPNIFSDVPKGSVDLNKSLFKPLVPLGDTAMEEEAPKKPTVVKVAAETKQMMDDDDDEDLKELQAKLAAAKKKKMED